MKGGEHGNDLLFLEISCFPEVVSSPEFRVGAPATHFCRNPKSVDI